MCRWIEEVEPTVGLPRHRHFVGFFNVPVQALTRECPYYGYSEKPPHLVAFYDTHGDTEDTFSTEPPGPHGGQIIEKQLSCPLQE